MYSVIKFYDNTDAKTEIERILKDCEFTEEQLEYEEDELDMLDTTYHMSRQDVLLLAVLWLICGIVIYGVYRLSIISRRKQYGLLQAIGMKQKKVFALILKELMIFYIISLILGSVFGILFAYAINFISESVQTTYIFWGKQISFALKFPWKQMGITVVLLALNILFVACFSIIRIKEETLLEQMNGVESSSLKIGHRFSFSEKKRGLPAYIVLAVKNAIRDQKSTLLIVISIGIASSL